MISIVIPLYNKEKSIANTLESVKAQTFTDWECIIVNDGSTDKSAEVVERLTINDERFRLINQENGGVCSARNRGIRESVRESEYVAFLDADDLWDKDYLKEQMRLVNDFPECGMWSINYGETRNGKIIRDVPTGLEKGFRGVVENYFELQGRVSDLCHASSVLIRSEVFSKTGDFDERMRYAEDDDMWWRIIAEYPFAFYDRYMVYYQLDSENRAMNQYRALKYFLPNYPEKYAKYKEINPVFYRYVQRWCAVWLARYYFGVEEERKNAKIAAQRLDYDELSIKYRIFFHAPYDMAKLLYMFVAWRKQS